MKETKHTFCRICESLCGLEITLEDGNITKIRPDNEHVATRGFACPKGLKQHRIYNNPDRLRYPMKREGKDWNRVSWDDAYTGIGDKVKHILKTHGPESIAMYVGTAAGFGVLHPAFAKGFMDGLGSDSLYASATQDCSNKFAVAQHMYGFPFTMPFPDIHHTDCLIITGANPVISKWSFLQVPNPSKHLKEMEARGAKLYIVDPRRTETAKVAGEHVFIRPNTDVFFFLAFLNEYLRIKELDHAHIDKYMKGFKDLVQLAKLWTPEHTEQVTRIPAATLRKMVKTYAEAKSAVLYCSTGVNMGTNGALAYWIQECINAISGNLDKKGGSLVGMGIIDFPKFGKKNGILTATDRSRVGNFQKVNDTYPGGILADEILTPGKGQIKALFVTGGNPLMMMANAQRLQEAFGELELLVTLDILPTETASAGHYMLPCTTPLERPDLPFIFPLMLGLQAKPYVQATKKIIEPDAEQRDEATIYVELAKACGSNIFGSVAAQKFFEMAKKLYSLRKRKDEQAALPQEFILSMLLRLSKQGGFKQLLKKHPHGRLRKAHEVGSFLGERVLTDDGLVDLAPTILLEATERLHQDFLKEMADLNRFKLISKRAVTTHNSWGHNFDEFVSGGRYTNYAYLHEEDMKQLGVEHKDFIDVSSPTATIRLPVKPLNDLMVGTIAIPHGWGHQASLQQVANKTKGVNVNILMASGVKHVDKVSGMSHLTGVTVSVKKAEGEQVHNWAGL